MYSFLTYAVPGTGRVSWKGSNYEMEKKVKFESDYIITEKVKNYTLILHSYTSVVKRYNMIIHLSKNIVEFDPVSSCPRGGVAMEVQDDWSVITQALLIPCGFVC